jgi:tetratricopeptide (TPR) repeat protein
MLTNDDGRTFYTSCEDGVLNITNPAVSDLTITDYELIHELIAGGSEVQSTRVFGDANHNGLTEMYVPIFKMSPGIGYINVYEFDENMNYTYEQLEFYGQVWAVGDINGNGLTNLIVQSGDPYYAPNAYLRIYESPDPSSLPTSLIQEIILPGKKGFFYASIEDIDLDGNIELLMSANHGPFFGNTYEIYIYEWGNNGLSLIWSYLMGSLGEKAQQKAVGDFDDDGNIEIVASVPFWPLSYVKIFECTGDDQYQFEQTFDLPDNASVVEPIKVNPDGGSTEFAVGMQHSIPQGVTQDWYFFKFDGEEYYIWYNTNYPSNGISSTSIKHTAADFDCDGYDEIFVNNTPYIKLIEYYEGEMVTSWVLESHSIGCNYWNYDINGNSRLNFIENYYETTAPPEDKRRNRFYEDTRLLVNQDITSGTTWDEDVLVVEEIDVTNELLVNQDINVYVSACGGAINVTPFGGIAIGNAAKFFGYSLDNYVKIDGGISMGTNVEFKAYDDFTWQGLILNNTSLSLTMNSASFAKCGLTSFADVLEVQHSDFEDSYIDHYNGNIFINYESSFINSNVRISHPSSNERLARIINGCDFTGLTSGIAINIEGYPNFKIKNCSITSCIDAISLYNCGYGKKDQFIENSVISENSGYGITVYRSSVDILDNTIDFNEMGVRCFDRSDVHLEGDHEIVTQKIKNNDSYEVLASRGSFPQYFHWNLVQDDDNLPGDPMVKYTGGDELLNVQYNCWGYYFDPDDDLYPMGNYIWEPVWDCLSGAGSGESSAAESLYLDARNKIEVEDYAGAKSDFQQIIIAYPTTKFAQAALKEIYSLEEYLTNNYSDLKTYYNSEPNIVNNPELAKLADFLVNFCEVKLENWPTAIAWFENVIQYPESLEDSIFAIVDLGYTYFLMEQSGYKSAYAGTMTEHIPVSSIQFEEKRDFLLSLLPGELLSETMKGYLTELREGELLQNVPNPFRGSTQIWYKLDNESDIQLNIYNYTGQLIRSINEGLKTKGTHYIDFNANGLKNGIYFYSISINGQITDSKKMTILK